jgi:PleD family two-component response regulator
MMLTNLPEEASADKARSLGAKEYFVKAQFEPEKLASKVSEVLEN